MSGHWVLNNPFQHSPGYVFSNQNQTYPNQPQPNPYPNSYGYNPNYSANPPANPPAHPGFSGYPVAPQPQAAPALGKFWTHGRSERLLTCPICRPKRLPGIPEFLRVQSESSCQSARPQSELSLQSACLQSESSYQSARQLWCQWGPFTPTGSGCSGTW